MSEKLTPLYVPMEASEISPDWIGSMRAMVENQGIELRGDGLGILALDRNGRKEWCKIHLPGGGFDFVSVKDRDEVLEKLGWRTP
jgi:hypothetical protein